MLLASLAVTGGTTILTGNVTTADVADGAGLVAECVVTGHGAAGLELTVQARHEVPRPDPAITVVQAIPKGDRGELAVEEMTEVGVDRIVPWAAARCVPVWQGARGERSLARWRLTAREATKSRSKTSPGVKHSLTSPSAIGSRTSISAAAEGAARPAVFRSWTDFPMSRRLARSNRR
jgi:16S rRNA (uracil1498-N3)-methyltransferase